MSDTTRATPRHLPTGRPGRLLAFGLLVLSLVLVWEAVAAPLLALHSGRADQLSLDREKLARMEALAARLPALRREAAAAPEPATGPAALIEGSSDAIASAALQEQVQAMASSLGTTLSSTETVSGSAATDTGDRDRPGAASKGAGFRRIGLRISVTAPFETMVKLLGRIERNSPVLLVDDLQLHGSRIQLGANPPLEASLTVLAFRRAGDHGDREPEGGSLPDDGGSADDGDGGSP